MHPDKQTKVDTLISDRLVSDPIDLGIVISAMSALAAAWISVGSTGLLAHPLRRVLTLIALTVAILSYRPLHIKSLKYLLVLLLVICLAVCLVASSLPAAAVMGSALVVAFLASTASGQARQVFRISSIAIAVFGIYRTVCTSVPWVWLMTDQIGRAIGGFSGIVTHQTLFVGSTFAGLDFLVLTGTLWALWLVSSPRPRRIRAIYSGLAILAGHFTYLIALSFVPQLLNVIPSLLNKLLPLRLRPLPWRAGHGPACCIKLSLGIFLLWGVGYTC